MFNSKADSADISKSSYVLLHPSHLHPSIQSPVYLFLHFPFHNAITSQSRHHRRLDFSSCRPPCIHLPFRPIFRLSATLEAASPSSIIKPINQYRIDNEHWTKALHFLSLLFVCCKPPTLNIIIDPKPIRSRGRTFNHGPYISLHLYFLTKLLTTNGKNRFGNVPQSPLTSAKTTCSSFSHTSS